MAIDHNVIEEVALRLEHGLGRLLVQVSTVFDNEAPAIDSYIYSVARQEQDFHTFPAPSQMFVNYIGGGCIWDYINAI